jgi:polysaccharide chain length determinant protein (PEP-CTERM system associated)
MNPFDLAKRHAASAWRHRWKALILAWFIAALGWSGLQLLPNQYASSARLYAEPEALLGTVLRGLAIDPSPVGQIEVLQRTLLSRPNLQQVIERTQLQHRSPNGASDEALISRLARDIRVTPSGHNLLTVEYRDTDPEVARDVVQAVVTQFVEAATGTDRRQMDNARDFIARQITSYEQQLREAERRRAEFQSRYSDLLALDGNVSRLEAVRSRLQELRGEEEDATNRRELLRRQLAEVSVTRARPGSVDPGVAEAQRTLRQLRLRYTEEHPDVIAARNRLAAARSGPQVASVDGVAPPSTTQEQLTVRLVDTDAQLASLERQVRDAEAELDRLSEMARNAPGVQAEFIALDRDYTVMRRNYEEFLARRESIQIGDAARSTSERRKVDVIDPPTLPTTPVAPKRGLLAAGVLLAAIAAGGALAVLLAQLDGSFYSVSELRKIGLPVLGVVSDAKPPHRVARNAAFASCVLLLFAAFAGVVANGAGLLSRIVA